MNIEAEACCKQTKERNFKGKVIINIKFYKKKNEDKDWTLGKIPGN